MGEVDINGGARCESQNPSERPTIGVVEYLCTSIHKSLDYINCGSSPQQFYLILNLKKKKE